MPLPGDWRPAHISDHAGRTLCVGPARLLIVPPLAQCRPRGADRRRPGQRAVHPAAAAQCPMRSSAHQHSGDLACTVRPSRACPYKDPIIVQGLNSVLLGRCRSLHRAICSRGLMTCTRSSRADFWGLVRRRAAAPNGSAAAEAVARFGPCHRSGHRCSPRLIPASVRKSVIRNHAALDLGRADIHGALADL